MASDPFDVFSRLDRAADPFSELDKRNDPFDAFGGSNRFKDPEYELSLLSEGLKEEEKERSYFSRVIHNAPHDITEFIQGAGMLFGAARTVVEDTGRLGIAKVRGDEDEVARIEEKQANQFETVKDVFADEVRRVAEVYGGALAYTGSLGRVGSIDPLIEQFAEDPLFTLLDISAAGKAVGAPGRLVAGRYVGAAEEAAGATTRRIGALPGTKAFRERVPGLTERQRLLDDVELPGGETLPKGSRVTAGQKIDPGSNKSALDLLREGSVDDPAVHRRAAMQQIVNDPKYRDLTLKERWAEVERLTPIMAEHAQHLRYATIISKMDDAVQTFTNPFRLSWKALGKAPPIKRMQELLTQKSAAMTMVAGTSRQVAALKDEFRREAELVREQLRKLGPESEARIMDALQSVDFDIHSLTQAELEGYIAYRTLGERLRPDIIRSMTAKGDLTARQAADQLDRSLMSNAITHEARKKLAAHKELPEGHPDRLTDTEAALYSRLTERNRTDKFVRRYEEIKEQHGKLTEAAKPTEDLEGFAIVERAPDAATTRMLQRRSAEMQLLADAEARLLRGELGFIPGQHDFIDLQKLSVTPLGRDISGPVSELDRLMIKKIKRKTDIVTDVNSFEDHMLKYVEFVAHTQGQLKLLDDVRYVSRSIHKNDAQHVMFQHAGHKVQGIASAWELVELPGGEVVHVPKGMVSVFKKAFEPDRPGSLAQVVDFTREEFAKVVLSTNPGWVTFNALGNLELFALGAGNPGTLAKVAGMKIADSVYKKIWGKKGLTPHSYMGRYIKALSEDFRELIPQSMVKGFTAAETRRWGTVEYIDPGEIAFHEYGIKRIADAYQRGTKKAVSYLHIGDLNEAVEEIFRGALWINAAERKQAAQRFMRTGSIFTGVNSMREDLIKLADEFDPQLLRKPGPTKLSREAIHTRDTVNQFLNDYYRLGPIERSFFRRAFPFYSWIKFTNKLAVELPMGHPIRMSLAAFATNAILDAKAIDETLPEWLQNAAEVKENDDGTTTFQSGAGEVFQGVLFGKEGFQRATLGMNPVLKMGIEFSTGVNLMRGSANRVAPSRAAEGLAVSFTGRDAYRTTETGLESITPRPSLAMAVIRSGLVPMPFSRQIEKAIRGGPHDDVGNLTELGVELGRRLTGGPRMYPGAYIDKDTGLPYQTGSDLELWGSGFGLGRYTVDAAAIREREIEKKLSAAKQIKKERLEQFIKEMGY